MSKANPIVGDTSCVALENSDSCNHRLHQQSDVVILRHPEEKAWSKSPLPPPPQYCDKNVEACGPDAGSVLREINTGQSILNGTVRNSSLVHVLKQVGDTTKLNINIMSSSPYYPRWPKPLMSPGSIDDEVDNAMPSFPAPINLPIRTGPRPENHAPLVHVSSLPAVRFAEQVEQGWSAQRAALAPRSTLSISLEDEFVDEEESGQSEGEVIQILI